MSDLAHSNTIEWLRSARFDLVFIYAIFLVAVCAALIVTANPALFFIILSFDLWLLGYHHVIATFTRFADSETRKEHRFLLRELPLVIVLAVSAGVYFVGGWLISTIYLHWQWWHYVRQSEGIAKAFGSKSKGGIPFLQSPLNRAALYLVPLVAFLTMSARGPETFLGIDVRTLVLPDTILVPLQILALALLVYTLVNLVYIFVKRQVNFSLFSYIISHYAIFLIGYVFIQNIDFGWLAINIWHNAQYIAFVWLFNTNLYKKESAPSGLMPFLSQRENVWLYFGFGIAATIAVYMSLGQAVSYAAPLLAVPLAIIVYQTINFHHYIVDSVIWKLRKKRIRENIGAV